SVMTRSCHCGSLLAECRGGLRVRSSRQAVPIAYLSLLLAGAGSAYCQCVPLTLAGYTQDFNTLANTGTSSTLPAGWALLETGTSANTSYTVGTGSSNAGDTYSFGAAGSPERALGTLLSGSLSPVIGACFTNASGQVLTSVAIAYTGEEWRLGTTGRQDHLDFSYSADATGLGTGIWTPVDSLNFFTPSFNGAAGATDGNSPGFRTPVAAVI